MNCTKEPCCNTCKHSRLQYSTTKRTCLLDKSPYAGYLGGHNPDYVCDKYEAVEWFKKPRITVKKVVNGELVTVEQYDSISDMEKAYKNRKDPEAPDQPADGCWNCMNFDWKHEACTIRWNNLDESYYNPDIDDRDLMDYCEYHELDHDADPETIEFGGNEP